MRRKIACIFAACLFAVSAAVPASAAANGSGTAQGTGFVESVENKKPVPVPESSAIITINGDEITIDDLDPYGLRFVITSVAEAEQGKAPCKEIADDLLAARDELLRAKKPDVTFKSETDEDKFYEVKERTEKAGKNLICCDLFDASIVTDNTNEKIALDDILFNADLIDNAEGQKIDKIDNKITLTLNVNDADSIELVMHRENEKWEVVDFVNNGNGSLTFTLDNLCPIAFFTGVEKIIPEPSHTVDVPVENKIDHHPKSDPTPEPNYEPPHPVPAKNDTATAPAPAPANANAATNNVTPVSNTTESPNTGTGTGSALLVSAILAALAGSVLVIKAKKE